MCFRQPLYDGVSDDVRNSRPREHLVREGAATLDARQKPYRQLLESSFVSMAVWPTSGMCSQKAHDVWQAFSGLSCLPRLHSGRH